MQRRFPRQLVVPVREQDEDRLCAEVLGQEGQQVKAGPVRPVQILGNEHDGATSSEPAEQHEQGFEQPHLG